MQCQVSKMTWEMVSISTLERLSSLTDVCMEYLFVSDASRNTMQSIISIQLLKNTDKSYIIMYKATVPTRTHSLTVQLSSPRLRYQNESIQYPVRPHPGPARLWNMMPI